MSLSPESEHLLERYLDGLLEPEQQAAFEKTLQNDPELDREVKIQKQINSGLKRLLVPATVTLPEDIPDLPADPPPGANQDEQPTQPVIARLRASGRLVAAVILIGAGLWIAWTQFFASRPLELLDPGTVHGVYAARQFKPDWVCEDDRQFAEATRKGVGIGLMLGIDAIGWAYPAKAYDADFALLSRREMALFVTIDGTIVVVVVAPLRHDRDIKAPPGADLRVFRREIDEVVLYEITPLDQPRVLPHFTMADD